MSDHITTTTAIVAAYLGAAGGSIAPSEVPGFIKSVYTTVVALDGTGAAPEPGIDKKTAAEIRKSITPDALICFEDGKSYKTLKRTLSSRGLTPETYRAKWGLPPDYPMVAPNYAKARSEMAKNMGLGKAGNRTR